MKKNITILLLTVVVIVLAVYVCKEFFKDNKVHVEKTIIDTFLYDFRNGYDYSSGSAQLYGYVEFENRSDASSNEIYKYVTFHILESNSEEFMKYLKSNADNTYITENSIGLGCLVDNSIKFINYSDVNETSESIKIIRETDLNYNDLLASTKDNPVIINVRKYINTTYYSYHPICESMLSSISTPVK
jgi:hypothetical protein